MTEPRMRLRHKGQQFPTADLEAYLVAFGDDRNPLPETVKVLDEIVTDFIIETCHEAAQSAAYARRAKIKVDDFKFMLRKDPKKLGRVTELLNLDKELKKKRKAFDVEDDQLGKENVKEEKAVEKAERKSKKARSEK
ncbi:hypothetical protein W97_02109 [Coniosporium apollinis CBS 100218]|uniref:Transcription initiation factor TFIID subunit 13 n=2 Tax=Coniosporium TaxID=2810619 RepID=R7YM33_CONA1|nr:uncharacterized protein W97_02109 [Coniosporium apollinis CBS 100218]EON62884.1 hypothetical protein W97_02109 [Coniosporium apollinis CBS 100218]KAJ9642487.1 hypothetical protein H2199_004868 [Cladosporium sp. JES 115]